jgi:GT2 family glycosyltransferase
LHGVFAVTPADPASSNGARDRFESAVREARAGRWDEAARAFAAAWRAAPERPEAAQGLLECAAHLARAGTRAPAAESQTSPRAEGLVSFVVCSIEPDRLARLRADLEAHWRDQDWELVHVSDARGLSEGYTRGLRRARGELIVCCHDDIGLLCDDFADRLRRHLAVHDLVGVAGTDRVSGPAWHWTGPPHTASWVSLPRPDGSIVAGLLGTTAPVLRRAQALDGVFLAGRRAAFERVGFDADTFDGFHFYDLDLSYRAHLAGLDCAVALDLLIWHQSGGDFRATWSEYADRFVTKFPELKPEAPPAPFRTGALVVDSALAAPIYAWIAHWLAAP